MPSPNNRSSLDITWADLLVAEHHLSRSALGLQPTTANLFLTGTIGVAFIRGIQGDRPGVFGGRLRETFCGSQRAGIFRRFDAEPGERDFYEAYLPHFTRKWPRAGHVGQFMGAYAPDYGRPVYVTAVLTEILRKKWGFDGYVVSDCGAINDIRGMDPEARTPERAAAAAVQAGCDLCCGGEYNALAKAVQAGSILRRPEIDQALSYVFKTRFRLGLFDPPDPVPHAQTFRFPRMTHPSTHEQHAWRCAGIHRAPEKQRCVAAQSHENQTHRRHWRQRGCRPDVVPGNYSGTNAVLICSSTASNPVAGKNVEIVYARGCPLVVRNQDLQNTVLQNRFRPHLLIEAAKNADLVIYVGGINSILEGEGDGAAH